MTGDVLVRLERALPTLRPAEARVAQTVLDDPDTVVDLLQADVRLAEIVFVDAGQREFAVRVAESFNGRGRLDVVEGVPKCGVDPLRPSVGSALLAGCFI